MHYFIVMLQIAKSMAYAARLIAVTLAAAAMPAK